MKVLLYDLNPTGHCPSWAYWSAVGLQQAGHQVEAVLRLDRPELKLWQERLGSMDIKVHPLEPASKQHLKDVKHWITLHNYQAVFFPNLDSILFNAGKYGNQPSLADVVVGGILLRPDEILPPVRSSLPVRLGRAVFRRQKNKPLRKKERINHLTYRGWKYLYGGERQFTLRYLYLVEREEEERLHYGAASYKGGVLCDPWISRTDLDKSQARSKLGIPKEGVFFLHAGTSRKEKGLHFTVQVFREELAKHSFSQPYGLLRAGRIEAADREPMLQMQGENRAVLLDRYLSQEELDCCYAACDWVLLPYFGQNESSGVLVNAAAHNRPVIASDYGKIGETVRQHRLGLVFPAGDHLQFANHMERILCGEQLIPNGMEEFAKTHSPEKFAGGLQNFGSDL